MDGMFAFGIAGRDADPRSTPLIAPASASIYCHSERLAHSHEGHGGTTPIISQAFSGFVGAGAVKGLPGSRGHKFHPLEALGASGLLAQ